MIQSSKPHQTINPPEITDKKQFWLSPFLFPEEKMFVFEPEFEIYTNKLNTEFVEKIRNLSPLNVDKINAEVNINFADKKTYSEKVNNAKKLLANGGLDKVVLSRTNKFPFPKELNPVAFFNKFRDTYNEAFCYLLNTPETGTWCGASPEVLCKTENKEFSSMSLAGTLPFNSLTGWSKKEIEEQKFVTDYILKNILEHGFKDVLVSKTYDHVYGEIKHLRTDFTIKEFDTKKQLISILKALHPTPAVCGVPKEKAKAFIKKSEEYDRKFYTGFLGPVFPNGNCYIFVNLRCAAIKNGFIYPFAGGGLTKESDASAEWEETEWKMKTLLRFLGYN